MEIKRAEVQEILNRAGIHPSRLIRNKKAGEGVYAVKFHYFYRHGNSPEKYAAAIAEADPRIQILAERDDWASWPKDSWMVVVFKVWESRDVYAYERLQADIAIADTTNREISTWAQKPGTHRLSNPYWFDPVLWAVVKTIPMIARQLEES